MRTISAISISVLSLFILGCGDTPIDNSANQPTIPLTVIITEDKLTVEPSTLGNGKFAVSIENKTADVRQVRIDGLGVNVLSLPIPSKDGKQQLILNMFEQKGKLILASTTLDQQKRLETNITIK